VATPLEGALNAALRAFSDPLALGSAPDFVKFVFVIVVGIVKRRLANDAYRLVLDGAVRGAFNAILPHRAAVRACNAPFALNLYNFGAVGRHALPLHLVGPIRRRHLALGNVLGVTGLERLIAFTAVWRSLYALLTKPDRLHLVTRLCHDDMALARMIRRPLWFVIT